VKNKKFLIPLVIIFLSLTFVLAVIDFNPNGDIQMKNIWKIKNATSITTQFLNATNNASIANLYFGGGVPALLNPSYPNRPLASQIQKTITVCDSGCDYTSINNALGEVPLIMYHKYYIKVNATNYSANEDVIIPATIQSGFGSAIGLSQLTVQGIGGFAKVKSIIAFGGEGYGSPLVATFNVSEANDLDNEDAAIEFYGVTAGAVQNIIISGNQTYALVVYSGSVSVNNISVGDCKLVNGLSTKHNGFIFGDDDTISIISGSVKNYPLVSGGGGIISYANMSATGNCSGTLVFDGTEPLSTTSPQFIYPTNGLIENFRTRTLYGIEIIPNILNVSGLKTSGNIIASNITGNLSWNNLYSYPVACPAGSYISQLDDAVTCTAPAINPYNFWNDTYATFNKTYGDTLYYGITNPNTYWNSTFALFNKTYADTLYAGINNPFNYWNSTFATFNKTYADTLYSTITEPKTATANLHTHALNNLTVGNVSINLPMQNNNITNVSYLTLSNGIYNWRIYVNSTGSLITESF